MKVTDIKKPSSLRKERNQELIRRMRNGESLRSFDSQSSWFPPRPIIEKDKNAISRLYSQEEGIEAGGKSKGSLKLA